jgi:hypothetical protein
MLTRFPPFYTALRIYDFAPFIAERPVFLLYSGGAAQASIGGPQARAGRLYITTGGRQRHLSSGVSRQPREKFGNKRTG